MQPLWQNPAPPVPGYRLVAANLARALSNYALVSPAGGLVRSNGLTLASSGIRYGVFNAAVVEDPGISSVDQLTARLQEAGRHYERLAMPWSFWFCREHLRLPSGWMSDLLFQRQRLRFVAEHMGMEADRLAPATRRLPLLDVRPVNDEARRRDFGRITGEAFELPPSVSREIYEPSGLWRGNYLGYVGYADGRAVCTAATCTGPEGIGLYSVGTAYAYRGRGYGEAITRAVIQLAALGGARKIVLQSTPSGAGLYQRLGFLPVTSVLVYATV